MAVRFRNEHTSWAVSSPITWKIEIFDADHVGGVTDFEVESGAALNYRGDGGDATTPILSSTLTFSMLVQDSTHEQLITDLAGAAEGRFTVVLYKDNVFNWAGVINSPEINIEDADYPFSFEIMAVDGLALLKNYEYKQNITSSNKWTEVYEGQSTITTIIGRCLKKLPHVVTHFTGSSKFLVTAVNWYSDLHDSPATSTYDPFFYTLIDNRSFADGQSGGAAKFLSCYDVLSVILKTFQARISLFDGYFLAEQFEHRYASIGAPANYSRYYDYALTAPTANTLTADQDIGGSNSIKKLRGGSYSFLPALKNVRVKQRLSALQNLIPTFNVSSDAPSAGYTVGWVKGDGLNTYVRFTGTIEFSMTSHSGYPTNDSTYATFNLRIELDSLFAKRNVTYNSNGTYSLASATWDASTSYIQFPVKVEVGATDVAWEGQTYKIDIIFRTDSTLSVGDMVVDFDLLEIRYFQNLTGGVVDPSYYTFEWTLRDAYCTIQEARTAFAPKSVTYQVDGDADNTQQLLIETIIGDKDGDIINQWGGLLFYDNPDYNYTATWGNRDGTRDRPIVQLLGQRAMQMFYFPRKILRGTAVGSSLVIQVPVTENSTETYFLRNGSYSTHRDELNGEWVRLVFSSESLTYQAAEYETGEYQANTAGSGGGSIDTGGGATGTTSTVVFPNVAQGDILYSTATNTIAALGKDANATRYLSNTGSSNNPAWAQVDLSNGVTGSLPFANIGTIATQKLLGRYSSGTGVIEQITISTGLALDGSGNLTASGSGGTVTSVNVSGGTTGMTFSGGAITTSGTITMSGTLDADNGGTGQSTYTVGDILYASAATTLTKLNSGTAGTFLRSAGAASPVAWSAVVFPNSAITGDILYASAANTYSALAGVATGNALISGGVSTAPSWGKIGLTTHVSGTLPVANGGTGATTFTAGHILYGNGTGAVTTNAALMYTSSVFRVQNSTSGTGVLGSAGDENIRLQNTDSTNNNWSWIVSYTQTSVVDAGLGFQHVNHSTREAAVNIHAYGGGGFQRIARFQNSGITLDKAVSASSTLAVTSTSTFTGAATFNGGITVNTVAPTINTNLSLGSSSVGSLLTIWNDYSSTSPAGSAAFAAILLKNRNGTANNWTAIEWDSSTNAIVADIGVQYLDHTADTGDISFHTRGASTGYAEAFRVTSEKLVGVGVYSSLPARFTVRGTGATSATVTSVFENSSGTDILYIRDDGKVSIGNSSPQQTFHVTGTMRLTGSDGTATALMGRDADGDISAMSISSDLAITSGTLGLVASTVITPPQITSTQNNYNPTGLSTAGIMLISADNGFRQITGITAPSTAKNLTVVNVGSHSILFPRESTSSSAANRIRMNRDFVLLPGKTMILFYDTAATKWRILSIGDTYADTAHLFFDNTISAPTQTGAWSGHWQYSSDGSDTLVAPTGGIWSGHELDTGTGGTGVGYIGMYNTLFQSSTTAGEATWAYFRAHITTPSSLSSGGETYIIRAGFMTASGAGTMDGIYFRYSSASSANWRCVTRSSATETDTNTTVSVAASTAYLIEIVFRPDGTTEFWLDGVSRATNSTNVPLTDLTPNLVIEKTAGANSQRMNFYTLQASVARVD